MTVNFAQKNATVVAAVAPLNLPIIFTKGQEILDCY